MLIVRHYLRIANKIPVLEDSLWSLVGNVVGRGLALAASIIVARFLGSNAFGEYSIIKATMVSLAILSTFGLGYTATKYIAEYRSNNPKLVSYISRSLQLVTLFVGSVFALAIYIFSDEVASLLLNEPSLSDSVRILSGFVLFNSLAITQVGILAGFGKFKLIAKVNSSVGLVVFILGTSLTYWKGLEGALIALMLAEIFSCLFAYFSIKSIAGEVKEINRKIILKLIYFSIPVALQEISYSVVSWGYKILLVRMASYADMGIYTAASQWGAIIIFIPGLLRNVVLSHMSSVLADKEKHNSLLRLFLGINFSVTFLIALVFYFFSDYLIAMYGSSFEGFETVITVVVITTIFVTLSNTYTQAYMSRERNWLMLLFRFIRDIVIFILAWWFLSTNSGNDGAFYLAMSELVANAIFLAMVAWFYEFKINEDVICEKSTN